ncbi:hypothetical protein JHK86_001733 [Glycine max]|nr:hypothetical protein JHK86_001733 [Glycine max]
MSSTIAFSLEQLTVVQFEYISPCSCVLCCLHARSLPPYVKAINWNTSHSFVQNNPLLSLLERCKSLDQLKQIQAQTVLTGLVNDGFAMSCLVAFYALLESGYVESEDLEGTGLLYKRMLRCGVLKPDNLTYPLLIKDCSCPSMNCVGFTVLGHVLRLGFEFDIFVHNASITMLLLYVELEAAYDVFNKGCVRDLVTWNAMITGCVRRGLANEAKRLYREMEAEKVKPNQITMIGIVSACSQVQDLNLGREFHDYLKEHGLELTIPLNNSLIDMHLKCGDLLAAWVLFANKAYQTLVSWATMVLGYARFCFWVLLPSFCIEFQKRVLCLGMQSLVVVSKLRMVKTHSIYSMKCRLGK